jgi:predicted nucleic acid-binding protein
MIVLADSDIVIEVMRGRNESVLDRWKELVESRTLVFYTPATAAEIWAGAFSHEHEATTAFFESIECLPIDGAIGRLAGSYLKQFRKSHGLELADALIAASAVQNDAALWTRNKKHYPMKEILFY